MGTSNDKDVPPPYNDHLTRTIAPAHTAPAADQSSLGVSPPSIDPDTLLPPTFKVGLYDAPPFITVPEMILHLRLLAAFASLQRQVQERKERTGDVLDGDTRWSVFCMRAESNFEGWVKALAETPLTSRHHWEQKGALPPLDVVMVWHSYTLNPRKFYEDCERDERIGRLGRLGFPLEGITQFIDPVTLEYNPPRKEKQPNSMEDLPFPTIPGSSAFNLSCPQCSATNSIMWLQSPKTPHGYCQKQFQHTCSNDECGLVITHEVLRVTKVCRDLVSMDTGQVKFLPGLGLMPTTGELTGEIAGTVSRAILQVFKSAFSQAVAKTSALLPGQVPFTPPNLAKHVFKWSFKEFENYLDANLKHGSVAQLCRGIPIRRIALEMRISKLYAAYHHSGIASLALGPAVMRQASFIGKMKSMGWLQPGRFEGGSKQAFLLQKAAARYHAFLDLMTTMPAGFLCPTLDIDLAWHTHQLKTEQYRLDTSQVTSPNNRFVDHDDKVSEVKLGDAYDFTSRAWLARYRVPYSQCGCHQGDLSAIDGNVVAALPDKLKFWNKGKADSKIEQRRRMVEQVIGEMQQDEKDASHPSVHNMISVEIRTNAAGRNTRLNKVKQLDSKAQTLAKASPASEKHLELKRALTKDPAHPDPFVQDLATLTHTLDDTALAAGPNDHGGSSPKHLPYWGVAVGGGLVVGGPVAWGLAVADPHLLKEEDCTRGACAAGVGAGGGGYCTTGSIRIGSCTGGSGQANGGYVGAGCAAG